MRPLVEAQDRNLAIAVGLIGLLCAVAIPSFSYNPLPLNTYFFDLLPLPVVLLMIPMPFAIYCATAITTQIEHATEKKEREYHRKQKSYGRIVFLSQMRPEGTQATSWVVRNANGFAWTNARLLIERNVNGKKTCEKHHMGKLNGMKEYTLTSQLQPHPEAEWRVMVITDQGRLIDFPDKWIDPVQVEEMLHA